jgi:DNA-directed RNA polymerase subunit RPC12/RpoP
MKSLGGLLIFFGISALIFSLQMDTSIEVKYPGGTGYGMPERVNNIGLMNEKQNRIMLSGILLIDGIILFAVGKTKERSIAESESENVRTKDEADDPDYEPDGKRIFYCQKCGRRLELEESEIEHKSFQCPNCKSLNVIS